VRISPELDTGPSNIGVMVPPLIEHHNAFLHPPSRTLANMEGLEEAAWLCQARTAAGQKRQVWLRGIRDDWVRRLTSNECVWEVPVGLVTAWDNFKAFILLNQQDLWAMKIMDNDGAASVIHNITGLSLDAGGSHYLVTTSTPHAFTAGQRVRMRGIKGANVERARGYVKVREVVSPTSFTINRTALTAPAVSYDGGGTARILRYKYERITFMERVRVSKRDTGRAYFARRGARREKGK
jgi:hypothetical protein